MSDFEWKYGGESAVPNSFDITTQLSGDPLAVVGERGLILIFRSDGRIEVGEGFTPDEAGKAAIEALRLHLGSIIQAEREACAKVAETAFVDGYHGADHIAIADAIRARGGQT